MAKTLRTLTGDPIVLAVVCPECHRALATLVGGDEWRRGDGVPMLAAEFGFETEDVYHVIAWPEIPPRFDCRRHGEFSVDVDELRRAHARIGTTSGTLIVSATRTVKKPGRS